MGIFDFVKENAEEAMAGSDLEAMIHDMGLPVSDLKIDVEDGIATVTGSVESKATKEKIILSVGNSKGISKVNDKITLTSGHDDDDATLYTVQKGDTLSLIAKAIYGDPKMYNVIFEANQPMIKDVNLIFPGQVLRIPKN